jgi:hypothetical protein
VSTLCELCDLPAALKIGEPQRRLVSGAQHVYRSFPMLAVGIGGCARRYKAIKAGWSSLQGRDYYDVAGIRAVAFSVPNALMRFCHLMGITELVCSYAELRAALIIAGRQIRKLNFGKTQRPGTGAAVTGVAG